MGKNLKVERSSNPSASSGTPGGLKTVGPMSKVKTIKGPSIKADNAGGKSENHAGVDSGTSVVSK